MDGRGIMNIYSEDKERNEYLEEKIMERKHLATIKYLQY
jgi:hypothetical protein